MKKKRTSYYFTLFSSIIIIICLIVLGVRGDLPTFQHKKKVRNMTPEMAQKLEQATEKYFELDKYNNTTINGSQLKSAQNALFKYNYYISVKTLKDADYKKYTSSSPYNITNPSSTSYINEQGKFFCSLVKNEKGSIVEVRFKEIQ